VGDRAGYGVQGSGAGGQGVGKEWVMKWMVQCQEDRWPLREGCTGFQELENKLES
jgi:hypothetical protein